MCAIRLRPTFFSEPRGKFFVQIISVVQMGVKCVCVCVCAVLFISHSVTIPKALLIVARDRENIYCCRYAYTSDARLSQHICC